MERKTAELTLLVPPTLLQRIKRQQEKEQVWSRSEMVRRLLDKALKAAEKQQQGA
jgi:metal-responsive CopG/Arc/MetJ family transcriptional regulator